VTSSWFFLSTQEGCLNPQDHKFLTQCNRSPWRIRMESCWVQGARCPLQQLSAVLEAKLKVKWSRYRPGVAQRVGNLPWPRHYKGVNGQQHAPAALYPRERLGTHCTGGWVGPIVGLNGRKISSPPGFDPRPSSPSQSLYRPRYPVHDTRRYWHKRKRFSCPRQGHEARGNTESCTASLCGH